MHNDIINFVARSLKLYTQKLVKKTLDYDIIDFVVMCQKNFELTHYIIYKKLCSARYKTLQYEFLKLWTIQLQTSSIREVCIQRKDHRKSKTLYLSKKNRMKITKIHSCPEDFFPSPCPTDHGPGKKEEVKSQ